MYMTAHFSVNRHFNKSGNVKLGEHTVARRDFYTYICMYTQTLNFEIKDPLREWLVYYYQDVENLY